MYVIVHSESGQIFGFGLTPKKAMKHFLRGLLSYDGPPLDTRRPSTASFKLRSAGVCSLSTAESTATALRFVERTCRGRQ